MAVHHQGALAMYSVSLSKWAVQLGGMPNRACHSFEQSILPSDGCLSPFIGLAITFYPAACQTRRGGWVDVAMSSIFGLISVVALWASISSSSSSTVLLGNSSHQRNIEGVTGWVHAFRASARLDPSAGDPNDMELSEHELCPDPPWPRSSPGGVACVTGDPGATFRSAFSWSVIGDILGSTPTLAMLNGGMVVGVSL